MYSDDFDKEKHSKDIDIIVDSGDSDKPAQTKIKIKNPRSSLTARKYQKQINCRRNKVKELLFKGCSQKEIASILHASQPTVSRDMCYLYNQQRKKLDDFGTSMFENHTNIVNGTAELLKKAWEILDNPKTEIKMKHKMMNFIMNCYSKRVEFSYGVPFIVYLKEKMEEVNRKEKYFKDNNLEIDYVKPVSMEEFREMRDKLDREIRDKEAVF
jgi:predicted transcriptional regulator